MSERIFYAVACSEDKDGGIHCLKADSTSGIEQVDFLALPNVSYLISSADRSLFYAGLRKSEKYDGEGEVIAFAVSADGIPKIINSLPSGGLSTCHVELNGSRLYCANYVNGTVGEFSVNEDGSLEEKIRLIQHEGSSINPARQEGPHAHCVRVTPDRKYVAAIDLGCDAVFFYPLDESGAITDENAKVSKTQPGIGPRHIIFNNTGAIAYIIDELGNSISVYNYAAGALQHVQTISTLPEGYSGTTKCSAIRFSPCGKYLLGSNRGHDSLAIYSIGNDSKLTLCDIVEVEGESPRDFDFIIGTPFLASANEESDSVTFFRCDFSAGPKLEFVQKISMKHPLCIVG